MARAERAARPASVHVLIALHLLLAAGALFGGGALMADPTGGLLGMPVALLAGSPFTDYLVPGIVLFVLLGLLPLATAVGLLLRPGWGWLRSSGKHLAWLASLMVGVLLIAWILVQMTILRFFLQPILLVQGIAIVGVGLLPVVRGHYSPPAAPQATRPSLR